VLDLISTRGIHGAFTIVGEGGFGGCQRAKRSVMGWLGIAKENLKHRGHRGAQGRADFIWKSAILNGWIFEVAA
jgi:hypothetical protein